MSEKKTNVPKIRFPGFTGAWERRRLKDVADYRNGKAHEKDIDEDGEYVVVNSKFVSTNGLVKKYSASLIEPLKSGEIAFVLSDVPNGKAIARTFLVDEDNKYSLNQRIAGITPHEDIDSYFLSVLMNRNSYFLKFDNGVGQTNLSKSEVENFPEHYPSYKEQVKVGSLFCNFDHLLTLHQRKLNHLQDAKNSLLQKMFPKNGEDVPEIRFPGFTHPWEQRRLKDIAVRVTRKNKDLKSKLPLTISAQNGLIDQNEFFNKTVASRDISGYYLVKNGEFAYNKSYSNGYPWGAVKRLDRYDMGVLSTLYIVFKPTNVNSDFLANYYDTTYWYREVYKHAAEGARNHGLLNISTSDFFETELMIPSDKEEQRKVGAFFKNLDRLITLQRRKLNHCRQLKKGLLQQMFV